MKKFILVLAIIITFFASCDKEDEKNFQIPGCSLKMIYSDLDTQIYRFNDDQGNTFILYDAYRKGGIVQVK